jgi:hypothetical protein
VTVDDFDLMGMTGDVKASLLWNCRRHAAALQVWQAGRWLVITNLIWADIEFLIELYTASTTEQNSVNTTPVFPAPGP